jgi:hypothetical protein
MSSACDTEDPDSLLNISRKGKKTGAPRQKAYDNSTCIAITRAMIAAKNDPYRGSDSKGEDFHSRFKAKYDIFARSDFTPRTISSLVDKFKEIRHDCGQFQAGHIRSFVAEFTNSKSKRSTTAIPVVV